MCLSAVHRMALQAASEQRWDRIDLICGLEREKGDSLVLLRGGQLGHEPPKDTPLHLQCFHDPDIQSHCSLFPTSWSPTSWSPAQKDCEAVLAWLFNFVESCQNEPRSHIEARSPCSMGQFFCSSRHRRGYIGSAVSVCVMLGHSMDGSD
jgi:hypothetical protein